MGLRYALRSIESTEQRDAHPGSSGLIRAHLVQSIEPNQDLPDERRQCTEKAHRAEAEARADHDLNGNSIERCIS